MTPNNQTAGPIRLLCDGRPVTIAPDGFAEEFVHGRYVGVVDYTVDATGERKWAYWPSPRFAEKPNGGKQ